MSKCLPIHPLSSFFPALSGQEFEELKADIAAHGQRDPIVMHEGMVLDGGNRARACAELGRTPITVDFGGNDPVAFVLSKNLKRRHLTPGQRAAIISAAADWSTAHTRGRPSNEAAEKLATLQLSTLSQRAEAAGVSTRTQHMADTVARRSPELARDVAAGQVSLPAAVQQVQQSKAPAAREPAAKAPAPPSDDLPTADDLLADIEEVRKRNAVLEAEVAAVQSGSPEAKALQLQRMLEHAKAEQSAAMERASKAVETRDWYARQLKRCGKAVGQEDPDKIAAAVESFVREHKPAGKAVA